MRLVLGIRYTSKKIYNFIQNLIKNGAKVEMTYEYEVSGYGLKTEQLDMKSLARVIRFNKELWKFMVCTSDSGMKLYEIEEYSDHEYITGYHAWNVTYFIDVIYGADMHYYISMKRGFIMTPETEIVKKQILSTENAEILLEENEAKRY